MGRPKKEKTVDTTRQSVLAGFGFVLIYLIFALIHRKKPELGPIIEMFLKGVLVSNAVRLLIEVVRGKKSEMGVFADLRIPIVVGAVVMLYLGVAALVKVIAS
ncbi:MAG TPA: hypothetical protein VNO50_09415 [Pyrinomonadaceae bacterium]|nr:hypothetical protein [Pyrinomonadaceae bacterium]